MQVPNSRYLMVVLDPGLDHSRITGLFHAVMLLPGVLSVTDMSMITQETVNAILMLPDETVQAEIRAKELMASRQHAVQRRLMDL